MCKWKMTETLTASVKELLQDVARKVAHPLSASVGLEAGTLYVTSVCSP